MVSQSPLLMEIPDLVPAHDYQPNISITKGTSWESQELHLPFSLQNNNVNETSHQHSQKRKEAEHMPQTLVLRGGGVLFLVGHPSTTPSLRVPWRFLIH